MLSKFYVEDHVKSALMEDIGYGDITTENLAGENDFLKAELNTRSEGVLCGCNVFKTVYKILSDDVKIKFYFKDGDIIKKGDKIADLEGPAKDLLMGERVSLNYIQRMSGIATETRKYQDAIAPYSAKIVDTRKTTPNFRAFEKYSVKVGGGALHRFNLSDCAMIKDNHIRLAGSLTNAVNKLRESISHAHKIEVECDTIDQVKEAIEVKADIIMLDNMPVETMKKAVELINHQAIVEASGNVNLSTVNAIASTGVDIISSSAIVAKAPTLDLALDM
ncbi:nicotinate-nucleotide diphosphorylase (carboxylating) [Candidatus Melainabacteria bacterium MEL.A1]|nr:nicotinate-nucleotide diphosphorylase (carboxylating) [Candidatus Melainabacteria bacterium MEL.A1]DAA86280.1 MAG TPA: nicotinate-nucleotide diphosphorylase (carboxylating) [Candidatus Gastranaerophilales bacterium HUM_2]